MSAGLGPPNADAAERIEAGDAMAGRALELRAATSGYDAAMVLRAVSLSIAPGTITALLGKNGMGKSTLLKSVMGYLPKRAGSVHLFGRDITAWPAHRVARHGVAYTPQEQALFVELSIRDNLRLGLASDAGFEQRFEDVVEHFPFLGGRLAQPAGTLSGGEQKMLLVARALMARPRLMLIDEITEGLQPSVITRLARVLRQQREAQGTAMLVVEQNVAFALAVADRYSVLRRGEIVAEGVTGDSDAESTIHGHLRV
jgi:ABC-type branched-subunit amino acid transport system ATPase component